jgi:hypothetical protein
MLILHILLRAIRLRWRAGCGTCKKDQKFKFKSIDSEIVRGILGRIFHDLSTIQVTTGCIPASRSIPASTHRLSGAVT